VSAPAGPDPTERCLAQFEGLIAETARQVLATGVELEFDDIAQLLRVKAWRATVAYDPQRSPLPLRRFVFGCLYNMRKDIEKRPRRHNASIDALRDRDLVSDWFDARYLSIDHEQVFGAAEDDPLALPCTLNATEREVIALRMAGRLLVEIDAELGLSRAQRERVMRSIRLKLADWAPTRPAVRTTPLSPLPAAEPVAVA
jgi:DNA-directed RNA polymerase specialized sigma24 family protein